MTDVVAKGSPLGGGGPVTRRQAVLPPASRRGARDACQPTMAGCRCGLMTMNARISGRAGPGGKRGGRARKDRPRPGRGRRARVAGTSRRGAHVGARARARRMETAAAARREGRVARDGAGRGRSTTLGFGAGPRRADPRRRLLAAAAAGGLRGRHACCEEHSCARVVARWHGTRRGSWLVVLGLG